jgi:hypothetical protein
MLATDVTLKTMAVKKNLEVPPILTIEDLFWNLWKQSYAFVLNSRVNYNNEYVTDELTKEIKAGPVYL